uniref:Transmembrane and coiled-coil domain-containing protein 4 n=1 Tax=Meloidogyne incognita TaxID=6306 RepID=A0A914KQU5_MELIC
MTSESEADSPTSSTSKSRGLSYSDTFPRHQHSLSNSSSSSSISQNGQQHIASTLVKQLSPSTRFAFTDLIITILRLDFYKKSADGQSAIFCNKALDVLFKWGNLPVKTQNSLRLHIEEATAFNEDIAALITSIKSDPFLVKHGCVPLLGSFLLAIIVDGDYDSRFRVLLRHISALLRVHWDVFEEFESTLGDQLVTEYKESMENQQIREKKSKLRKYKRYAIIGAATGLGGVLIGVTGGLAAPLIVASISALTATTIFAGLTGTAITAIFGSLFGVAGAGLSGYRMQKRVGDIEEFTIERLTEEENRALHCVLCVSGWIEDRESQAFRTHWRHLWMSKEQYTLRWESKYLEELGKSIEYFVSFVVSYAVQRSLMETVLAGLVSAIAWPLILLGSSSIIDNPWNICTKRAAEAGEHLAEVLLTRSHGRRPITLIGFSLGARVIYHCLMEMNKRKPYSLGIVEDVILLGAPVSASPSQWRQICSVVGGRVINGYCKTDWLLRFLYRTMSVQFVIAGTGPVDNKNERKIVNFNLSHIVKGHMDYSKKLTRVLESVGARVAPLSKESRQDLERFEELQRKLQNGAKLTSSLSVPNLSTLDEEKSSIILEQSKELISREDEDYEGEDEGLRLRGDPLGVSELRIKRTHSLASAETFHSAMSTLN